MINIINRLADVDEKLKKWNDNETECDYHIYLTFVLNFFIFGSFEISQMQQYPLITILDQVFDSFASSGVIVQYVMLINMITKRFEKINTTIAEFYTMKIRTDRAQTSYVIETSVIPESTFYSMDNIFHAYIELCDLCDALNNIYGLPILITILFLCAEGIFLLYFIILVLISFISVSEGTYLSVILVSRAIFLVMVLTSNVTKIMDESKKTVKLINLLMLRSFTNQNMKKQLIQFSNAISHLKIKFSACDIMPLDRTLITIISSTVATYLIIVVQFRISSLPSSNS